MRINLNMPGLKKFNLNKTIITIILLNTIQIGAASGIVLYDYLHNDNAVIGHGIYGTLLFFIIIVTIILNSFITIRDVSIMEKHNLEYNMLRDSLKQVEKLNNTLRGQRHDFMNHLQVVYGLMEMDEYNEAGDYIEKVFNDIQRVSKILKTANPAINALFQAKSLSCEKRGIRLEFNITSRLDNLNVPSWEFCRIIANVIDNSIYALKDIQGDKCITIDIYEDLKKYGFKIGNNGPEISEDIREKIFEAGFTTKGEHGEGMGLSIAKDILNTYGGDITVESSKKETIFDGWVSKQQ
jgi:sensor histidine kinase regulating citrate/malate metabolism